MFYVEHCGGRHSFSLPRPPGAARWEVFYVEHILEISSGFFPSPIRLNVLRRTHPHFAQQFNGLHSSSSLLFICETHYAAVAPGSPKIEWGASSLLPIRRAAWVRLRLPSTSLHLLRPLRSTHCWSIAIRSRTRRAASALRRIRTASVPITFL